MAVGSCGLAEGAGGARGERRGRWVGSAGRAGPEPLARTSTGAFRVSWSQHCRKSAMQPEASKTGRPKRNGWSLHHHS